MSEKFSLLTVLPILSFRFAFCFLIGLFMLSDSVKSHAILIQKLNYSSEIKTIDAGNSISLLKNGEPVCIIIYSGIFSLYRRHPRMLIGVGSEPIIIGLSSLFPELLSPLHSSFYIFTESSVEYKVVSCYDLLEKLNANELWREVANCLNYSSMMFLHSLRDFAGHTSEMLVINAIRSFNRHHCSFKEKTILSDYIQNRTSLSRATVMNILKKLKVNHDINIKNGRLVNTCF